MGSHSITKKKLKYYLILFAVAIGVYSNTFNHDFVLDDEIVFTQNKFVQEGVRGIPKIISHGFLFGYNGRNDQSYRPVVLIYFALAKSTWGNNPYALHKMNVLLYAILCSLLFYILSQLFQQKKTWLPFWISLLFVLHPIHTEVVANIKSADEILHALFILLSLIFGVRYVDQRRKTDLVLSLVFYCMALFSKEMAITYVALFPLCIWTFRAVSIKKIIRLTFPYIGVLLIYFFIRGQILDTLTFGDKMKVINNGLIAATSYSEQLATTFYIFANYIKLLFFPHPLSWDYSYPHFEVVNFSNLIVLLTITSLIIVFIFSCVQLRKKNKLAFSVLFFLISFSVVSNFFVLIGATLGERLLFSPSIAFCIFVVLILQEITEKFKKHSHSVLSVLVIIVAVPFALKTFERNKDWETNYSLFLSGVEASPNNSRAIAALGSENRKLAESNKSQQQQVTYYQKAIDQYQRSIQLLPTNADSHYNLGVIYMTIRQDELARKSFEETIKIVPEKVTALNNLGVLHFRSNQFEKAREYFNRCLTYQPDFQDAYANLGAVYHNTGYLKEAKEYYLKALELDPNDQNTRSNLKSL